MNHATPNTLNRRPKSSVAQWLTALAAVVALVVIVAATVLTLDYLHRVAQWYDARNPVGPPTVATFQEHCLDYTGFVLDQHRAGLDTGQIQTVLDQAAHVADQFDAIGRRLDDPQACGTPAQVLQIVGAR
ncbi:hypothetical protein ACFQZZ_33235 [Nocardia sp. GCM10030253]|uniref:hypothetical protein n=1 Tax=Nocardia sp. GCM10030253 TaxID=3273404 RepID=UPI00362F37FF